MESPPDVPRSEDAPGAAGATDAALLGWRARVRRELRSRPIAWVVFALFVLAGPLAATWLFPEAPLAVTIVGGLIFGGYCALSAVPQKFL